MWWMFCHDRIGLLRKKIKLVVKGFKQIHGIDYYETLSPVTMLKSVQILLAIAAYFDYDIW
jgi:hypothetical protein